MRGRRVRGQKLCILPSGLNVGSCKFKKSKSVFPEDDDDEPSKQRNDEAVHSIVVVIVYYSIRRLVSRGEHRRQSGVGSPN